MYLILKFIEEFKLIRSILFTYLFSDIYLDVSNEEYWVIYIVLLTFTFLCAEKSFLYNGGHRYVFPGAEVYFDPDDQSDSSSSSDEEEENTPTGGGKEEEEQQKKGGTSSRRKGGTSSRRKGRTKRKGGTALSRTSLGGRRGERTGWPSTPALTRPPPLTRRTARAPPSDLLAR